MSKKILVVEDELDNLKLVSHFLNQAGYEVSGAKDGVEAMELLGHSRFDLVLSDLRMPGMDGLTLASHIVSSDPTTPILLMTAYYFDNRADILELGVPFLRKPFSPNELLSKIQKVIGEAKADYRLSYSKRCPSIMSRVYSTPAGPERRFFCAVRQA